MVLMVGMYNWILAKEPTSGLNQGILLNVPVMRLPAAIGSVNTGFLILGMATILNGFPIR